ncbi:LuxR family transcriptional regulator [Kitasatospora sp. NPDC002040]|uniref:LuxR family transcriptional regulator n=1 Tax=Kitasatospora sp. NPDC002040 TaxID=3154661 RepID=UPI00331C5B66
MTAEREHGTLDEAARSLYLTILDQGGSLPFADAAAAGQAAVDQLTGIGLLVPNLLDSAYAAVDPRAVLGRVGTELRSEATRLLVRADELPSSLDRLVRAYDAAPPPAGRADQAVQIEGHEEIRRRITRLVHDCRIGVRTSQPGLRDPADLAFALGQDVPMLQRGRVLRTLYQPSALSDPAVVRYATAVTGHGAQVRVLDEAFERMLIFDGSVAVVRAAEDHTRAAFITDPAAVAFLVSVFERDWLRADAVRWGAAAEHTATDRVGRLLSQGLTQRGVAGRLGVSERTVAGHIARLRAQYGAQTLFQLGWQLRGGRNG